MEKITIIAAIVAAGAAAVRVAFVILVEYLRNNTVKSKIEKVYAGAVCDSCGKAQATHQYHVEHAGRWYATATLCPECDA